MEILLQLGGCAKGNNSLLIFFCYVQRDCQHYFSTQQSKVYLRGSPPAEVHQIFHIFSLLMTTLVFVELLERSVPILKGFWIFMSQRKVKNLIMTKHLFFFAIIHLQIFKMTSKIALVPRSFSSTGSIWVSHHQQGKINVTHSGNSLKGWIANSLDERKNYSHTLVGRF